MFDQVLNFLNNHDLTKFHLGLGLLAFFLCVYVMAMTGYEREDINDPLWVQWGRRFSYAILAMAIIWSLNIQLEKGWQPWPPYLLLMAGLIVMFVTRLVAVHHRIRREGHRREISHSISRWVPTSKITSKR